MSPFLPSRGRSYARHKDNAAPENTTNAAVVHQGDDDDMDDVQMIPPTQSTGGTVPHSRSSDPRSSSAAAARRRAGGRGPMNVRGFGDLGRDDSDNDDQDQNEYFTGGERSGMMVQDPKQRRGDGDGGDRVGGIFEQALAAGADHGRPEDLDPNSGENAPPRMPFSGTSYTLGDGAGSPSAPSRPSGDAGGANQQQNDETPITHTITFYRNGFVVNDSNELRLLDDPANAPFLQSIAKGECPRELEGVHRSNRPVHVNLVRSDSEFVPRAKPKYVAFGGTGRTLGSNSDTSAADPQATSSAGTSGGTGASQMSIDESKPVTSVQIRLADGTRMVARFNHHHTVGDLRNFIIRARPDAKVNFAITTSFPPTPLDDDEQTIKDAGLCNAVVQQKML